MFVYSLAVKQSANKLGEIDFWIGARYVNNNTVWIDEESNWRSYKNTTKKEPTDEEKYKNLFKGKCFDSCIVDENIYSCGVLDLGRNMGGNGIYIRLQDMVSIIVILIMVLYVRE
jgi:hypothetical protein